MENKPRILVVDDEKDVRLIIRASLEPDYEVYEAQDGLDALEKVTRIQPDLIILDVMMPLMDGYDTCSSIRKNDEFANTPVMFLSALTEKEQIKKGYACGGNLYLTKPFDPDRLKRNITMFFQQTPPSLKRKHYTKAEIVEIEKMQGSSAQPRVIKEKVVPAPPEQVQQKKEIKPQVSHSKITPRIMVVDDDENIYDYILLTLRDSYEVVWAKDGFQAIERIVSFDPDMILLDIMIPKVSGYQLCSSIRKNKAFASIPIIMISAKGEKKDIDYAYRMGANSYLVKPFSPQDLLDLIDSYVSSSEFKVKPKKISFASILELEQKDVSKITGEDAKYVKKIDDGEKQKDKQPGQEE